MRCWLEENDLFLDNAYFHRLHTFDNNDLLDDNFKCLEGIHKTLDMIYSHELTREMFCRDYITSMENFYRYVKEVNSELEANSTRIGFDRQRNTTGVLYGYLLLQTKRFIDDLYLAKDHFYYLQTELRNIDNYWKKLIISSKNQFGLVESRAYFLQNKLSII